MPKEDVQSPMGQYCPHLGRLQWILNHGNVSMSERFYDPQGTKKSMQQSMSTVPYVPFQYIATLKRVIILIIENISFRLHLTRNWEEAQGETSVYGECGPMCCPPNTNPMNHLPCLGGSCATNGANHVKWKPSTQTHKHNTSLFCLSHFIDWELQVLLLKMCCWGWCAKIQSPILVFGAKSCCNFSTTSLCFLAFSKVIWIHAILGLTSHNRATPPPDLQFCICIVGFKRKRVEICYLASSSKLFSFSFQDSNDLPFAFFLKKKTLWLLN